MASQQFFPSFITVNFSFIFNKEKDLTKTYLSGLLMRIIVLFA